MRRCTKSGTGKDAAKLSLPHRRDPVRGGCHHRAQGDARVHPARAVASRGDGICLRLLFPLWCAAGIVLITAIGWIWFRQALDLPAVIGMGLIMAGVVVINLFSKTLVH